MPPHAGKFHPIAQESAAWPRSTVYAVDCDEVGDELSQISTIMPKVLITFVFCIAIFVEFIAAPHGDNEHGTGGEHGGVGKSGHSQTGHHSEGKGTDEQVAVERAADDGEKMVMHGGRLMTQREANMWMSKVGK
ncbi:hypothetical protein DdX_20035 [Ditylenchus destructor]|uniref:Uncharacterized protein n=1 Tax=Ditylenchus destructor TaxID=166010 RepID=A0AAD4MIP5_9BILA|nr:hypothetical protein DdX_20035 [Ditylenchus destructor]